MSTAFLLPISRSAVTKARCHCSRSSGGKGSFHGISSSNAEHQVMLNTHGRRSANRSSRPKRLRIASCAHALHSVSFFRAIFRHTTSFSIGATSSGSRLQRSQRMFIAPPAISYLPFTFRFPGLWSRCRTGRRHGRVAGHSRGFLARSCVNAFSNRRFRCCARPSLSTTRKAVWSALRRLAGSIRPSNSPIVSSAFSYHSEL